MISCSSRNQTANTFKSEVLYDQAYERARLVLSDHRDVPVLATTKRVVTVAVTK